MDVVVPTVGRPSLSGLLEALAAQPEPRPAAVYIVDDRPGNPRPVTRSRWPFPVYWLHSDGHGPAAARNVGWRAGSSRWVVFLDDDVVPSPSWSSDLAADLAAASSDVGGVQGRIFVPLPQHRRPKDWERNVAGLATARWATADMAYRRAVLEASGGFNERFRRAYREDADLALRVMSAGYRLASGRRRVLHPVGRAGFWTSVRLQAGNADDVLMRVLHGRRWRSKAEAGPSRKASHVLISAAGVFGTAAAAAGRPRWAAPAAAGWLGGTAWFAWRRIAPGPRDAGEVARMAVTSAVIPFAASAHMVRGAFRAARLASPRRIPPVPDLVLFDRDGTLIEDVPYNSDPDKVRPVPGALEAVEMLRRAGVRTGVVSNQSGVGRGLLSPDDVEAVNRRVEELLGPLDPWVWCPHVPSDGCRCRKPAPGLVLAAARKAGVAPHRCAVVGDTGGDVGAARAAGARAILVPNAATLTDEVDAAPEKARSIADAVELLMRGCRR